MQEVISRILEGNFDYENGSLDFSCTKLELVLQKGEACIGSFFVYAEPGRYTEGHVSASDLRMECLTSHFVGESGEISYCFHGEHMEEGDVVKGNFCIISNQGEYYLPFVVSVEPAVLESSAGSIKNLFHFTNLAKSCWEEAVALFYSPGFARILEGNDSAYYDCYRGLSAYSGNEQNVEEFLIQINKKLKVSFLLQESELLLENLSADPAYAVTEAELNIVRNGWGYTALQVECEGDFVFTEKELLTDDDFLGNRCRLPVFIDTELCRGGRNFGRIFLYNSYVSLTVPVEVRMGDDTAANQVRLSHKQNIVKLMQLYQNFRLKKIGTDAWLKETGELVDRMVTLDEGDVAARLFQAQLLISGERYNEAKWLLDFAEELMERSGEQDNTLKAYYLYLTTLVHRKEDYTDRVTSQVEKLYRHERGNWRVAWLLLYLSEEYNKSAGDKWDFLEKQFEMGCTSPVLYIEALNLLNGNPALLRRLDGYGLQVLCFGARRGALNADVLEQVLYLSGRTREYSSVLLIVLKKFYEDRQDVRILQEICGLLIKGSCVGDHCFKWYLAGVEANLKITRLYEYFMMSIDLQKAQTIPKAVLLYFSYQNSLDYEHKAFLYHYILKNRAQLEEIYLNCRPLMERFVVDQIQKDHINRHLAALYQEFLTSALINDQTAGHLAALLFAHRIQVGDTRLRKVVVYQPGNLAAREYALQDGVTWVALYGNDCTVLFEDAYGNRFAGSVDYTLEKLMLPGKYLRLLGEKIEDSAELDLYFWDNEREADRLSGEGLARAVRMAANGQISLEIRRSLYLKLMRYYYDTDDMGALDSYLESVPGEALTMKERAEVLRYMVLRGRTDVAWKWVRQYGPYFAEQKTLMRLTGDIITQSGGAEDDFLVGAAHCAFRRGKYDSRILQYLADYLNGSVRELRDVWKAARSFDIDCYRISERLLAQMLYSGAFVGERMEIFRFYIARGANAEVEQAFLSRCAYDYFVKERLTDAIVFDEIRKGYLRDEEVQRIGKLAFLKYYGENTEEITPDVRPVLGEFLQEMLEERIRLNFFRSFIGMGFPQEYLLREMMDKTIVEYRAHPSAHARIHYVIQRYGEDEAEYLTDSMREVYGGVFFKEFVLFFGESLQYYIVEEEDGAEQLTESGSLQKSETRGDNGGWRYEMINDIAISRAMEDYDTLDSLAEEYFYREYLFRELFVLM